jgi:alpha-1,6-mannosyltransferase
VSDTVDSPGELRLLLALGLAEAVLLTGLGWLPSAHMFPWPGLLVFAGAFGAYALAAWCVGPRAPGAQLRTIWLVAIGMRLALLPLAPELTDDFYRYLWDGHVQLAGTNPYVYAPGAPEVEGLRTAWHHLVNNPGVPTIYPPLAQIAFLLIALGGSGVWLMKCFWIICDLATAYVLTRIARRTGRSEARTLLLYAWAPLLVVEVGWSGHLEPLGLLMIALAIWAATACRAGSKSGATSEVAVTTEVGASARATSLAAGAAGAALALSALTKFAPAAALPALVRRLGWRALAGFAATVGILYVPYMSAGEALFTGLRTYSEHWWFMKGAFSALEVVTNDPLDARQAAAVIMLGVIGWTTLKRFDVERALLWVLGAGMILTPTLHPWYVLWMLPMAALRVNRPFLLLGGLAFIGYFGLTSYQGTGDWIQPRAVRAALWLPFFALLAWDGLRRHMSGTEAEVLTERG